MNEVERRKKMKTKTCILAIAILTLLVPMCSVAASLPSHDLAVGPINVPSVQVGVTSNVRATVTNVGSYTEHDVEVRFIVDGSLKQSKVVAALKNGSSVEMSFLWTPPKQATFNLTVYVAPVPSETNTTNNAAYKMVWAGIWMPWKQVGNGQRPSMATDGNGYLYIAYHQYESWLVDYGHTIYVERSTDGGWSWTEFGRWTDPNYRIGNPSIAIDPYDNRVYVAYELARPVYDYYDIYCKVYKPGVGWAESVRVTNPGGIPGSGDDRYPSITSEYQYGSSNWQYISFEALYGFDDRDLYVARSKDHGATWPDYWRLHGGSDTRVYTQSEIINAEGNLYVAYRVATDYYSTDGDIRVDISSNYGWSWTTKSDIDGTTGNCGSPSIAATHGGDLVMVAFVYQSKILYSYSQFKGSDPWHKGYMLDPLTTSQSSPHLAVDGEGKTSNSVYGCVHAIYIASPLSTYKPLLSYKKTTWSNPTSWSARQDIVSGTYVYSSAIATQYRTRGNKYYPCVAFVRYLSPNYEVKYTTVAPLPFNYALSVSPKLVEVEAGGWTTFQVKATLLSGPTRSVALKLYDLPDGVTLTFFTSNNLAPNFTTTLLVCVYSDALPGKYNLTIVGNGYEARSTTFTLNVKPKSGSTLGTALTFEQKEKQ